MEESLWDVEQREKRRKERIDEIKNVVGRDTFLPKQLIGKKILVEDVENPEKYLQQLGYNLLRKGGWAKAIDKGSRFHVYISVDRKFLHIHRDLIVNNKHKTIKEGVKEEKERIKGKMEIDKPKQIFVEDRSMLSMEERKAAVEKLKADRIEREKSEGLFTKIIKFIKR